SRPVSYITYRVASTDGKAHDVQVLFSASADVARNTSKQPVVTKKSLADGLSLLKAGTIEQPILQKKGDDLRIDWGYMYVAAPAAEKAVQYVGSSTEVLGSFQNSDAKTTAEQGTDIVLNTVIPFGKVGATAV